MTKTRVVSTLTRSGLVALLVLLCGQPSPAGARTTTAKDALEVLRQRRARALFFKGQKLFNLRQFGKALRSFNEAYDVLPLPGFLFNIGQCHRFLGNYKKAIFSYSAYIRANPGTPDAVFVKSLIHKVRRQLQSRGQMRQLAQSAFIEGKRLLTLQQYKAALTRFNRAYKILALPGYLYHIAEAHRGMRGWAKAIYFYGSYLKANPGAPHKKQVQKKITSCRVQLTALRKKMASDRIKRGLGLGKPGAKSPPVYKKWWFWTTLVLGVAAAAAVGLGVGLTQTDNGPSLPDAGLGIRDYRRR